MLPPAERFKNTSNRMAAAAMNRKTTLTSAAVSKKEVPTVKGTSSNWIKDAKKNAALGNAPQVNSTGIFQRNAMNKAKQEENFVVTKPVAKQTQHIQHSQSAPTHQNQPS